MDISTNFYPEYFPNLNVSEVDVVEGAAGPGRRMVIWLQGCLKRCPGCANGPFLVRKKARILSVADLLHLYDSQPELSGITLSGGEPVLQAQALLPLIKAIHDRASTVVSYTGYQIEELRSLSHPDISTYLDYVDLLIDGEYERELSRSGVYQPSANQRLHFLTGRIDPKECDSPIETVFHLSEKQLVSTGILPKAIRLELFEKLSERGIHLSLHKPGSRDN